MTAYDITLTTGQRFIFITEDEPRQALAERWPDKKIEKIEKKGLHESNG